MIRNVGLGLTEIKGGKRKEVFSEIYSAQRTIEHESFWTEHGHRMLAK